jgi:carboxymethylenebutenolidase
MNRYLLASALALSLVGLASGSFSAPVQGAPSVQSTLPSAKTAHALLDTTRRHREWVSIDSAGEAVRAFVVYPERADKAPVIVLGANDGVASDQLRATADQLAAEGFISIVPEGAGAAGSASREARLGDVQRYGAGLAAASGQSVILLVDFQTERATVTPQAPGAAGVQMPLTAKAWPQLVSYISGATNGGAGAEDDHSMHMMHMDHGMMHMDHGETLTAAQAGASGVSRMIPRLGEKLPNLPASYYTASATLAHSKFKSEWVDIPVGDTKVHTWVVYPNGAAKTGVVIVMQHGVGLDDWMRSVADQIASDGFIAVAPDAWSGAGPNGGNRDSFQFPDDAIRAGGRITPDETQRRYKAARDWALKLPRANGKVGSIGFCAGGPNSFRFAAEVPDLNAAVVFYGGPPSNDMLAKINAPVLALYGENDARVTATVAPTVETMRRLGKSYEPHIYPKVTHSFVYFQDLSVNREAVADAWPRVVSFFKRNLGA